MLKIYTESTNNTIYIHRNRLKVIIQVRNLHFSDHDQVIEYNYHNFYFQRVKYCFLNLRFQIELEFRIFEISKF